MYRAFLLQSHGCDFLLLAFQFAGGLQFIAQPIDGAGIVFDKFGPACVLFGGQAVI